MHIVVQEYVSVRGRNRFREWFDSLSAVAAAKVSGAVAKMAAGNAGGLKAIGQGLSEWRIDWGPGLRIYVTQDGRDLIVLFGGSDKSRQLAEINQAKKLCEEFRARKKTRQAESAKPEPAGKNNRPATLEHNKR